jgi:Mg/Co/Ni transporter MgtE
MKEMNVRVLATWIGVFGPILFSLPSVFLGIRSGILSALIIACSTLWGIIYLLRVKDKTVHEKIGLAVNILQFATYIWATFVGLMLPRIT